MRPPAAPVFSRLLVPTDFSTGSAHAWTLAKRLAGALGAELVLIHVLAAEDWFRSLGLEEREAEERTRQASFQLNIPRMPGEPEAHVAVQKWAESQLDEWASQARTEGLTVRTILRAGRPRREIVAAIADSKADLVVMSTHGRGGVDRLLYGSVADPVIRTAPCPVLAVRQPA